MPNLKQVYLDCGKYPSIIITKNYQNTGMCLIKQLRFEKFRYVDYEENLIPIGEWTREEITSYIKNNKED